MLLNYIKAALNSWYSRKVFTLLTILGMAFSIVLTTCVATYWGMLNSPQTPESKKEQFQFVTAQVLHTKNNQDLKWHQIAQIKTDEWKNYDYDQMGIDLYTVFSGSINWNIVISANHYENYHKALDTDKNFFKVFDFNFITGSDYQNSAITDQGTPVVIIQSVAEKYFGTTDCVGKIFIDGDFKFLIKGVVSPPGPWSLFYLNEVFVLEDFYGSSSSISIAFLPANDSEEKFLVRKLNELADDLTASIPDHVITLKPESFLKAFASLRQLNYLLDSGLHIPIIILIVLLPLVCMISLFRSIIAERTEELGVRKSFGAHAEHITQQFILECILITLLAGILAIAFSLFFWKALLEVEYVVVIQDIFIWRVFVFCILTFIVIGSMTGYFASRRLSKGSIVNYLSLNTP